MYETMRDQKTVTIADDTVIQKLRKMGFPRQGRPLDNVVSEMLEDVCTNQALLQHPRFFAFVPSPASPLSWVGDVLTDAYNPHGGTWMESSAASCLEQETIQWLCQQAGYPQTAGGLFVSGGSIANLTALAAARHAMLAETEYSSGVAYLSEQAHFSILKALRIMGLTKEQIQELISLSERICGDDFVMISFEAKHVKNVEKTNADLVTQRLSNNVFTNWFAAMNGYNVSVAASSASKYIVNLAHRRGREIGVWTVNSVEDMKKFVEMGVDYITTDFDFSA